MIALVFGIWLQTQLLLLVSFAAFRLVHLSAARPSFAVSVRVAQGLVIASLAVPIALACLPSSPGAHPLAAPGLDGGVPSAAAEPASHAAEIAVSAAARATLARPLPLRDLGLAVIVLGSALSLLRRNASLRALAGAMRGSSVLRRVRRVSVLASDSLAVPLSVVLGRRAFVVVPEALLLRSKETRAALAHELEHHRRRDTHWARFVELPSALCWPNPAMRAWARTIVELQELACDEAVLARGSVSPRDYAACLTHVAEAALAGRHLASAACMADAVSPSFLRRRIQMLTERRPASFLPAVAAAVLATVALGGAAHATRALSSRDLEPAPLGASSPYDAAIETIAQRALERAVEASKAKGGFVIVSEPATGRLLAVASTGAWTVTSPITPASGMKPVIAAVAIQSGATTFDAVHDCERGKYVTGGKVFRDWTSFDRLTTSEMIVRSSSICGIKVAEQLGERRLRDALAEFGFAAGGSGALADIALGASSADGFHATPLEMVGAFGAFANGGHLMTPLAWDAPDSDVRVVRDVLTPEISAGMRDVLHRAVTQGTGSNAKSEYWTTAGKTSSSSEGPGSLAGFIGFAPVSAPRVVVYAGIAEPQGKVHGNGQAAPVFREVVEAALTHLGVAPDRDP